MGHFFIIKLLLNPIQEIITTRGCHRLKGRRCLADAIVQDVVMRVSKNIKNDHVNGTHKSMAKYIKKHGCFVE
jgi:hypothetical protein